MRVTVFGFLCRDRNVLPNGEVSEIIGGKGLFTAAALAQSGIETTLITWLPASDLELLDALAPYHVTTHVIPMETGTVNTNTHDGDITIATTKLDPKSIAIADLTEDIRQAMMNSELVLLMPDIENKIALETITYMSNNLGITVAADVGKYFRTLQSDGTFSARYPWPAQSSFLSSFTTIYLSVEDIAPALEQGESLLSIARSMAEQGPAEVVITRGSQGASIFQRETNELIEVSSFPPPRLIDPTGAGDTFVGAYAAERLRTDDPHAAGRYGAMAASLKLGYQGPLRENREIIDQRLSELPV